MPTVAADTLFGPDQRVEVLEPDLGMVLRIWWALVWRTLFAVLIANVLVLGVVFFGTLLVQGAMLALGAGPDVVSSVSTAIASVVSLTATLAATMAAVASTLRKGFKGFRLVIFRTA